MNKLSNPKDGEMVLKEWLADEAMRHGISPIGIYYRMKRGKYPNIHKRYISKRTVMVSIRPMSTSITIAHVKFTKLADGRVEMRHVGHEGKAPIMSVEEQRTLGAFLGETETERLSRKQTEFLKRRTK